MPFSSLRSFFDQALCSSGGQHYQLQSLSILCLSVQSKFRIRTLPLKTGTLIATIALGQQGSSDWYAILTSNIESRHILLPEKTSTLKLQMFFYSSFFPKKDAWISLAKWCCREIFCIVPVDAFSCEEKFYVTWTWTGFGLAEAGYGPESNVIWHSASAMALSSRQNLKLSLFSSFLHFDSPTR